uniref:Fe2OG dioxygenase domain-containing protein n=1 Tax=Araucaria cunninghamii TaxID=56994 RepID=A0A0D6QZS0_ARACU
MMMPNKQIETAGKEDMTRERENASRLLCDRKRRGGKLPENYIRRPSERPRLTEVVSSRAIPLIDMKDWSSDRPKAIQEIGRACLEYGFFQIVNHGVPEIVTKSMIEVSAEFFEMPTEDRIELYSDDPSKTTRLSTSFKVDREKVFNWRDFLRLHCYPVKDHVHTWPSKPLHYRKVAITYCTEVRALVLKLLEAISESLGLEPGFLDKALGNHAQHMAINYYPLCPDPELTFGLPPHSDPNALTVLLQDEVSGLQVFKDGQWIAVNPIPNSFVVNIGDQIQVLSNSRYKSVLHRAVVNSRKARISIPTFYCPSPEAIMAPAPALVDSEQLPLYRSFSYMEYYQKFWSKELQGKSCLDYFMREEPT